MLDMVNRLVLAVVSVVACLSGGVVLIADAVAHTAAVPVRGLLAQTPTAGIPGAEVLGIGGIVIGIGTAIAGVAIPLADRVNSRQQARLDHEYRMRRLRSGCDDLVEWSSAAFAWQTEVRRLAAERGLVLPPTPGEPPTVDFIRPPSSDEIARLRKPEGRT